MATSPFITLLDPRPGPTAVTITTTDWANLVKTTKDVDKIVRNRLHLKATWEMAKHPSGPLGEFWIAMDRVALGSK
jgi:hypothetical protein